MATDTLTLTPWTRRSLLRRSMRGSTWECILAMPLVYLGLPGNLVLAALLSNGLGLPPDRYGLIASFPFWCNFVQLFFMPLVAYRFRPRHIFIAGLWVITACWGAFSAVLWFAPSWVQSNPALIAGAFVFAASAISAVLGVGWTTWIQAWVPPRIRGKYFSQRNFCGQVSNLIFILVAGAALARPTLRNFALVLGGSVVLRFFSTLVAHATPAEGPPPAPPVRSWREQWRALHGAKAFRRSVVFGAAWGFVANGFGAFQPVFMLQCLTDSPQSASLPLSLSLLFGALSLPTWGRLIDRFGARPVLWCALALFAIAGIPWMVVTRDMLWLLYLAWALTGAANAGIALGQLHLLMKLLPAEGKALAVGLNTAAGALGMAVAPIITGSTLAWALGHGWAAEAVYRGFFHLLPVFIVFAILLLRRIDEPRAAPVEHVVGALRNFRTLAATLGLGFLAQTLVTPRGDRKRSEY